jgi:hypothetical protein
MAMIRLPAFSISMAAVAVALGACAGKPADVSFKNEVQPLLANFCGDCHKPGTPGFEASGFGVDSYASVMKGTRYGPVVIPGNPLSSNLQVLVEGRASPAIKMPHDGRKMSPEQVQMLHSWIEQGARDN